MNIYASNETNFTRNGYGFLTDCISAKVTEVLNGDMYLEITYPINGQLSECLTYENIIKCNVGEENYQLFRIKRVVKSFDEIYVYATHIFYDLLDNMLVDVFPQNLSANNFGNWLLSHTNYETNFTFQSDISDFASARYVRKNPVEAIIGDIDNSMINIFGGELERDNFNIKLNASRGENRNVKLIVGKNIKSVEMTLDISSVYTRIIPVGFDGLTIPEIYVDSSLISNYPTPKIATYEFSNIKYDPENEQAYHALEEAYQALRDATNELYVLGVDKPTINVKVDWLELSKTEEYKTLYSNLEKVRLGDTITAELLGISYQTKVNKTIYNVLSDMVENFEIGSFSKSIVSSINMNAKKIESMPTSIFDSAVAKATELITSAMGGYVYKTNNELFIMDSDNPEEAVKVWRWNINGLGYSSTGINGPYGIAMTQDGSIVADYVTTGTMSADRIQGLNALTLQVQNMAITKIVEGIGNVTLEDDVFDKYLARLSIHGDISLLFPNFNSNIYGHPVIVSNDLTISNDTYISSGVPYNRDILYPSSELFSKNSNLIVDGIKYKLDFDYLNVLNDEVYDEYFYDNGNQYIMRRVGIDEQGNKYELNPYVKEIRKNLVIEVNNNAELSLESFENAFIKAEYYIDSQYTKYFVNKDNIISQINLTPEGVQIDGNKISLYGKDINLTSDNIKILSNNFNVDSNGNMTCASATLTNGTITSPNFNVDSSGNMTCSNANITGGTMSVGTNFSVSSDGTLNATNGSFAGSITSDNGNIAGFLMDNKSFTKNVSGIYNYDGYDLRICQSILLGSINPDFTTQYLMDAIEDGQVTPADLLKIQQIVSGESTSTKNANAVFEINSYDPKHCISVKDVNTVVASLGIGGVNGTTGTFRNIIASTNENPQTSVNISGVNGSIYASGTITPGSREELKKNIEIYDNALDDVINTDIYSYNLKTEEDGSKKHIGFVIGDKRNYSHNITTEINGEEIGADLYSMTSVLWKAVQEQQKIIESLQNQINELKESDK